MSASSDIVRFGVFELDRRAGELRKAGVRLSLQPQPLQVLSLLLERPGQVVTRDELRRQLWPDDTFVDFQHGLNAAVNRLRETLGDSAETPRFIETLPRRGYRFVGSIDRPVLAGASNESADGAASTPTAPPNRWPMRPTSGRIAVGGAVVLGVLSTGAWWAYRSGDGDGAPMRVVPLTTLRGHESWPSFSPDASQVVFAWRGEHDENLDVYVKVVGHPEVRRLTTHPLEDTAPRWSPDGQHIAFVRVIPGLTAPFERDRAVLGTVYTTSPLGGSEMKVSNGVVAPPLAWSPDGRHLAARMVPRMSGMEGGAGIYLIPLAGGEPRALTSAEPPMIHVAPAFSPDGRRLAYASCGGATGIVCELHITSVDDTGAPKPARRLTRHPQSVFAVSSLTWTRDGRSIIYGAQAIGSLKYLWRIDVDGSRPPERVELAGLGATMPVAAKSADTLAFVRSLYDVDIFRFQPGRPARLMAGSTFDEIDPSYSPDGSHIAFSSSRSGDRLNIWLADAEGGNARQLTHGPGLVQGSPSWSPDGGQIAFDSFNVKTGSWNVWVVDVEGAIPRQLTSMADHQAVPTWSQDGRWVYFAAGRRGSFGIWRVPIDGGPPLRITRDGTGRLAAEAPGGTHLVFQAADADSALLVKPVAGGTSRQIVPCVLNAAFGVGVQGVYYVPCDAGSDPPVRVLDLGTGADRLLGRLEQLERGGGSLGLAVAPDGRELLYPRNVADTADLMLIENFR